MGGRGCRWLLWPLLVVSCRLGVTGEKQHALRSEKRDKEARSDGKGAAAGCFGSFSSSSRRPLPPYDVTGDKDEERGRFLVGKLGAGRGQVREAAFEAVVADVLLCSWADCQGRVGV